MLRTACYTDIGGRPQNEDTVLQAQLGVGQLCTVVADGLGGHGGGELASSAAAKTICGAWRGEADPKELCDLVRMAHDAVVAQQTPFCKMKSTVVVLEIDGAHAAWAHVGDSRLYRFHNGKLEQQTRDHSASQIAVALGEITLAEIRFHEDRNRVLRALGQEQPPSVEVEERDLPPGRTAFLLCTDGFWEYVMEEEMEADLRAAIDPEDWIAKMRARLSQRVPSTNDNNTAAAVWVDLPESGAEPAKKQ